MALYSRLFGEYSHTVAQVLLTRDVIEDKHMRNNVSNTFEVLLSKGIIPIVNENDTVSIDEIENICRFGDNDKLGAIVAKVTNSDLLIILSDIDGLYDCDPRRNENAKLVYIVDTIDDELEQSAGGAGSDVGTGGMKTKIEAAKLTMDSGINMIIANGSEEKSIDRILSGEKIGTLFIGRSEK